MINARAQRLVPGYQEQKYYHNPIKENRVIDGGFYQVEPMTIREMVTRKVNKSLCFCLMITIVVTFVSYYIAMNYEAKLNSLDSEIVRINAENQDLQAELDRYKSFNNVDNRIGKLNLLQKADKVIEVNALETQKIPAHVAKASGDTFSWSIGY